MTSVTFLRAASIFTLLYCAGHTAGMPWTPGQGPAELAVIDAMKSAPFDALGARRTYWDFYFGFGLVISGYLLVQAVVLWQLASLAKTIAARLRPVIVSFLVAFIFNAIVIWKFFFSVPLAMAIAICVCLVLAFRAAGESATFRPPTTT